MNKVVNINSREISYGRRNRNKLTITDNKLVSEWNQCCDSGKTEYLLNNLQDEFTAYHGPTAKEKSLEHRNKSVYYFLGSIVIYFSELNSYIPLLAPVLFLLTAFFFYKAFKAFYPHEWTIVHDLEEEDYLWLKHSDFKDQEEFDSFLEQLRKSIVSSKNKN